MDLTTAIVTLAVALTGGTFVPIVQGLFSRRRTRAEVQSLENQTLRETIVTLRDTGHTLQSQVDWFVGRVKALESRITELEKLECENNQLKSVVRKLTAEVIRLGGSVG